MALLLALFPTSNPAMAADLLKPVELRCEFAYAPLGVDVAAPRLSWQLEGRGRGRLQTARQILVASSAKLLAREQGDLWDSGKVHSDEPIQVRYQGSPLASSRQVFWKVRVWDESGHASDWSKPATWTMGVLVTANWQAKWIGSADTNAPSLLLRREFEVKRGLRRALVHVCGLGQYDLSVNGRQASEDLMTPGWSQYDKTCLYDTHDVTALLKRGSNAIGLVLGNGMYNVPGGRYIKFKGTYGPQKAIAQLRLEYANGTVEIIGTDDTWRVGKSPITFSCVYGGEDYDARLEPRGWDAAGFDASAWQPAIETMGPGGTLKGWSVAAPAFRKFEVLKSVKITIITHGITVHDLGQNASLMAHLRVSGPAGSVVRIIPAELVHTNGTVDRGSVGGGESFWQYTLSGEGREEYFPKFFYHGARYLQVECQPAPAGGELPVVESIEGVVVHSASETVGDFECSNDLFNRIHRLIRWAQRSNLASVITDCPHRERLGWLEQYHLNGPSLRYEFDLARMFAKGMNDMADAQLANGFVPNIAPEYVVFGKNKQDFSNAFRDSPEWGSAFILVPWQQYVFTGDVELLRRHYDQMKRYVAYLGSRATNHIVRHGLGDWYDLGPKPPGFAQLTPKALTATAFYQHDTWILSQAAALLGKVGEAREFGAQAEQIRQAFNHEFYNPTNRSYATGSQCANAIALVMNLIEPTNRAPVLAAVVHDVRERGNAITAGDVGYRYLLRALAEGGRSDVIFDMNNQSEKPGYGYQLNHGATSLTEAWDTGRGSSQNHFMLGQIMEWFYGDLAGIEPDPSGPGFKKIVIKPQPVGDVTWARASYNSVRGKIATHWRRDGNNFVLRASLPANTTSTVYIPAKSPGSVIEAGVPARESRGVRFLRDEAGCAVFEVAGGEYTFEARLD